MSLPRPRRSTHTSWRIRICVYFVCFETAHQAEEVVDEEPFESGQKQIAQHPCPREGECSRRRVLEKIDLEGQSRDGGAAF